MGACSLRCQTIIYYVRTNFYNDTEKLTLQHQHETLQIRKKDERLQL